MPPSVELLGLTTHKFLNPDPRPPSFKPDWRRWSYNHHLQPYDYIGNHSHTNHSHAIWSDV